MNEFFHTVPLIKECSRQVESKKREILPIVDDAHPQLDTEKNGTQGVSKNRDSCDRSIT